MIPQFTFRGPVTVKAVSAFVLPTFAPRVVPSVDDSESDCVPFIVAEFPKRIVPLAELVVTDV